MKKSTHYNVRVIENEKGNLSIGFVHVARHKEGIPEMCDQDGVEWMEAPLKERRELTRKLIPAKSTTDPDTGMVDIQGPLDKAKPRPVIQILVGYNGDEVWVNVDGVCKFRGKKIEVEIEQNGRSTPLYRTRR